jgi:hypothetical protein
MIINPKKEYNLVFKDEVLNGRPLTLDQAEKQKNACIYNFGYEPQIMHINETKMSDFKAGDKIYYRYSGFGPKWIYQAEGEVLKINQKTIKVALQYGGDIYNFNVAHYELRLR